MVKKILKRKGRTEASLAKPVKMKYKEAIQEAIEPVKFYDPWLTPMDGIKSDLPRDYIYHKGKGFWKDKEEVREHNKRIFKQLIRRKAKKGQ